MRLIDERELVRRIAELPDLRNLNTSTVGKCIKECRTIDAVQVVRCRDCLNFGIKASIKYDGYRDDVRLCMLHGIPVLPDDYCSGGVKMDLEGAKNAE